MEEIHFKLCKSYQKEEEILDPFKNSRTEFIFFVLCLLHDSENDLYKTIWYTLGPC